MGFIEGKKRVRGVIRSYLRFEKLPYFRESVEQRLEKSSWRPVTGNPDER